MMMDDSAFQAANARAAYMARPWLKHYSSFVPPELATNFSNGLEMFLATVRAMADQAATYYFDETITYGELDRKSTALAAALKEGSAVPAEHPPISDRHVCDMESRGYRCALQPYVQAKGA